MEPKECGTQKLFRCIFSDGTKGFIAEEMVGCYFGTWSGSDTIKYTRTAFPTDITSEQVVDKPISKVILKCVTE
jgi:hypothetical protein